MKKVITLIFVLLIAGVCLSGAVELYKKMEISFKFYGTEISLAFSGGVPANGYPADRIESILRTRTLFSKAEYSELIVRLQGLKAELALNDWGYLQLLKHASKELMPNSENGRKYLIWHLLEESGYEVSVAFANNRIYLLVPNKETVYGTMFSEINGVKYYNFKFDESIKLSHSFYLYPDETGPEGKFFTLAMDDYPEIEDNRAVRRLVFENDGSEYLLDIRYDLNLIDFLQFYPQTDLNVYYNMPWQDTEFLDVLGEIIEGKGEEDAVNVILRFMHQAFEYRTDKKQFGREKVFFPEEMFFYPYSDCEDRTVFLPSL